MMMIYPAFKGPGPSHPQQAILVGQRIKTDQSQVKTSGRSGEIMENTWNYMTCPQLYATCLAPGGWPVASLLPCTLTLAPANPPSKGTDFLSGGRASLGVKLAHCLNDGEWWQVHLDLSLQVLRFRTIWTAAVPQWQPHDTMHDRLIEAESHPSDLVHLHHTMPQEAYCYNLLGGFQTAVVSTWMIQLTRALPERMEFHDFFYQSEMLSRIELVACMRCCSVSGRHFCSLTL